MKKCLCLLLSLTMLCLCAGAALAETVALKVWGSQEDQELLAELCEAFAAEHPETTYEFTYGVPMTADNGYFLYYDRSVVSDEDAGSFDTLLAAAEKAGKKVQIDISNGWYLAGFFLGNGCTLTLDENGNQICDFNSEKGLQAAEAIRAICNHPAYTSGDDTVLQGGMGDAICAGISGTWVAAAMKEKLGDNYAAAKLPTFTVDGEQVQMGSFLGCKILGVNTQTQHPVEAMELAEYLTSEDAQIRRYEVRGYGPSNLNAAASEEVSADVALSALAAQSEFGVSQHVLGTFWTPAEAFGAELEAHSEADLQTLLDQFVSQVTAQ